MPHFITPEDILKINVPYMGAGNYEPIVKELNRWGFSMAPYEIKEWYINNVLRKKIADNYWKETITGTDQLPAEEESPK